MKITPMPWIRNTHLRPASALALTSMLKSSLRMFRIRIWSLQWINVTPHKRVTPLIQPQQNIISLITGKQVYLLNRFHNTVILVVLITIRLYRSTRTVKHTNHDLNSKCLNGVGVLTQSFFIAKSMFATRLPKSAPVLM